MNECWKSWNFSQGNLSEHMNYFKQHVDELVPDVNNKGLVIIDFESWRPIYRWNLNWKFRSNISTHGRMFADKTLALLNLTRIYHWNSYRTSIHSGRNGHVRPRWASNLSLSIPNCHHFRWWNSHHFPFEGWKTIREIWSGVRRADNNVGKKITSTGELGLLRFSLLCVDWVSIDFSSSLFFLLISDIFFLFLLTCRLPQVSIKAKRLIVLMRSRGKTTSKFIYDKTGEIPFLMLMKLFLTSTGWVGCSSMRILFFLVYVICNFERPFVFINSSENF